MSGSRGKKSLIKFDKRYPLSGSHIHHSPRELGTTLIDWNRVKAVLGGIRTQPGIATVNSLHERLKVTPGSFYKSAEIIAKHIQQKKELTAEEVYKTHGLGTNSALALEIDRLMRRGRTPNIVERLAKQNLRTWGYRIK